MLCPTAAAKMRCMTESIDIAGPVESFQVTLEAAEMYEAAFVPAFFAQWAPILCDEAGISEGMQCLTLPAEQAS